ncbi:MAG: cation:proton antiporter [Parvibaculaceae bacterium]|nr:cation:proton antiporter [Parvibaculaceae bacterium]
MQRGPMGEEQHAIPYLRELVVFLAATGLIVPALRRARLNMVLGYLIIGGVIGPFGLGLLADDVTWLQYVVISDVHGVQQIAELGIIFLLFTIGLELSFERLWSLRRMVFGLGALQVTVSGFVIGFIAYQFGNSVQASIVLGSCLALSSTAIVMRLLGDSGQVASPAGRTAFSVLLFQDLAVVPILFLVGVFGVEAEDGIGTGLLIALSQAVAAVAFILFLGRVLLQPLFRLVGETGSPELFMAVTLLTVIGMASVTGAAGLSMPLGAFLAGLLLGETEFKHQIEVDIDPVKGLLLGLFFMSVGMAIDYRLLFDDLGWVVASVAGLLLLKASILMGLALLMGVTRAAAIEVALLLAQGGEFAFVVVSIAGGYGILAPDVAQFILIVTILTMMLTPFIASGARWLGRKVEGQDAAQAHAASLDEIAEIDGHVIVAGYGRVGRMLASLLERKQIPYLALDQNMSAIAACRAKGLPVYFGDASHPSMLARAGAERATALILTMDDPVAAETVTAHARANWADLPIYARARDVDHARRLAQLGADHAVPENLEASLQLADEVLTHLGIPTDAVRRLLAEKRDIALIEPKSDEQAS